MSATLGPRRPPAARHGVVPRRQTIRSRRRHPQFNFIYSLGLCGSQAAKGKRIRFDQQQERMGGLERPLVRMERDFDRRLDAYTSYVYCRRSQSTWCTMGRSPAYGSSSNGAAETEIQSSRPVREEKTQTFVVERILDEGRAPASSRPHARLRRTCPLFRRRRGGARRTT